MTNAEIEQRKERVKQLTEEVKKLRDELVKAGAWSASDDYIVL